MTFEPTRPGNPNQLALRQHVFPRAAIARFVDAQGNVQVQSLRAPHPRRRVPEADIFCGQRVWDQATETYRTRREELAYLELAADIAAGKVTTLSPAQDDIVTWFISLWNARHLARRKPTGDLTARGLSPEPNLTKQQEENAESNGVMFMRGTVMPSRFMTGVTLRIRMDHEYHQMRGKHWGIVRSKHGEFLVPDNSLNVRWIPVTPNVSLSMDSDDVTLDPHHVAFANRLAVSQAHEYYFARDLSSCPILRRTIPLMPRDMWLGRAHVFGLPQA